jgi:catechol 2,3-dioxygenase-like lactoylglutathione lyase family enzyme
MQPLERAEIVYEKPLAGSCDEELFGSDRGNTLWVKFSDIHDAVEWIGKFGCGHSSAMRVTKAAEPDKFMITAGGFAYLVDATNRTLLNHHLDQFTVDCAYEPRQNVFVVADGVRIRLVEAGKVIWASPRIALDGIRNLKVENGMVCGLATTGYEGEEEEFSVDLDLRKVTCATDYSSWDSFQSAAPLPVIKKPWWKIW